jgi:prepilin-type processing-associated H-X9-DG protein
VQVALIPPDSTRRVIEELMPRLPDEVGGRPGTVLTRGIRWAALAGALSPQLTLRLTVKSQDAAAAESLRSQWLDLIALARRDKEVRHHLPEFEKAASLFTPKLSGGQLTVNITENDVAESGLLAPMQQGLEKARESARRAVSMNHLKQIALAMHMYNGAKNHLPAPAIRSRDGKALLSWRVAILPYLSEEQLYNQFHLDEPWDSPHNKPLIAKMPEIFRDTDAKADNGRTRYLVPVGGGALYSSIDEEPQFKQIIDGTSNTIMVVQMKSQDAVIWTKPDDLSFDPKDPKKGLGEANAGGFNAAFCDGSVRFLRSTIDPKTLKALFTRAGGEVIGEY